MKKARKKGGEKGGVPKKNSNEKEKRVRRITIRKGKRHWQKSEL